VAHNGRQIGKRAAFKMAAQRGRFWRPFCLRGASGEEAGWLTVKMPPFVFNSRLIQVGPVLNIGGCKFKKKRALDFVVDPYYSSLHNILFERKEIPFFTLQCLKSSLFVS